MPSYLVLANWTEQGIKNVKESPQRLQTVKDAARAAGGKLVFFYMTMGEYDFATLFELPNDDAAAKLLLNLARQGNVRTKTLRAFTEQEYAQILGGLG